ncbi:MAG: type I restriction enzyme S subunit [bacterium]|nr:MAG: type I restriction enzyme S subunit [bacterium]KAF0147788.1 MAG: type I restriction enzyme S subunit [bacterium]KAF0167869.1 MAG: type I restriction enzyme S subunit [bacterium]TXT19846.1 MAG: type I restriction enzyme S subunit [bacterium]
MIDGLKPYPEYKDSGVAWLGEVPGHWEVLRLKYVLRERDARSDSGTEQLLRVSQYTGVTERKRADGLDEPDTRAESLVGYKQVEPGELVVNIMLAWNGSMAVSSHAGITSPAYCVYRFGASAEPWYFHHLLRSPIYKARIKAVSTGVVESRLRLYTDDLYRLQAALPPIDEQSAIVRFLDHADRRVWRYIRAKQKLIKLLEEQKQAIIHRAVTRGLDPDVRLKPSGVEWLRDVPEHWEVHKLKRMGEVRIGLTYSPSDVSGEGTLVLRASNIKNGRIVSADNVFVSRSVPQALLVAEDDILICVRSGSRNLVGKSARISREFAGVTYGAFMSLLRSESNAFIYWVLNSNLMPSVMSQFETSTINQLTQSDLRNLLIPVPPTNEQTKIVAYLTSATAEIDATIASTTREISLLHEYRTRLIADVVTGKLDVRAAAASLPEETEAAPDDAEPLAEDEDLTDETAAEEAEV